VVGDDDDVTRGRLLLAGAARQVLANGLALMGVSAPERMERASEAPA
jgi:arginyl-tRNA synthetase